MKKPSYFIKRKTEAWREVEFAPLCFGVGLCTLFPGLLEPGIHMVCRHVCRHVLLQTVAPSLPLLPPKECPTPSPSSCASRRKSCGTTRGLRMKRSQNGSFWSSRWRIWSTNWRPRVTSKMTAAGSSSRWRCVGTGRSWAWRMCGPPGNVSYVGCLGFFTLSSLTF